MTDLDLLHLCFERSSQLASRQAFVGLDGFVDRIVKAVDKRVLVLAMLLPQFQPLRNCTSALVLQQVGERILSSFLSARRLAAMAPFLRKLY